MPQNTYRKPRKYYGAENALAELTDQMFRVGLVGVKESARLREKQLAIDEKEDAQSLVILAEQFNETKSKLDRAWTEYDAVSRTWRQQLGDLDPVNITTDLPEVTKDLHSWMVQADEVKRGELRQIKSKMEEHYTDLADIQRIQTSLGKIALFPDFSAGDTKKYDTEDLSVSKVADIFNVDESLVSKLYAKQPDIQLGAVGALNIALNEIGKISKSKEKQEKTALKEITEQEEEQVGSRLAFSKFGKEVAAITASDLSSEEQRDLVLDIGRDMGPGGGGISMGVLLSPENEPARDTKGNIIDDKKTVEIKRGLQMREVMHLYTAFESFKKDGPKDIMGVGRFVDLLDKRIAGKTDAQKTAFKAYVNNVFNIDMNAKEQFIFQGYTLTQDGKVTSKKLDAKTATVEDMVLSDFKIRGLSKLDYFQKDLKIRNQIIKLYQQKHSGITTKEINEKMKSLYNLL